MESVLLDHRLGLHMCVRGRGCNNSGHGYAPSCVQTFERSTLLKSHKGSRVVPVVLASSNDDDVKSGRGKGPNVDWDKSWKSFQSAKKKGPFQFMEKYVSRSPQQPNFPMVEEVDSLRRTEKTALNFWINPKFTYAGFGVIIGLLLYMVVIVGPPPTR